MAQCITPYNVKDKMNPNKTIPVPCGRCPPCVKRKTSQWSFRLMQQDKVSYSSQFITLTYDTKHVPLSRNGFMQLSKRDVQLFFKSLRKRIHESRSNHINGKGRKPLPVKYYAVGEYGGKTSRPHYHIILFNAPTEFLQPSWPNGTIHYGTLSGASVGYTLKYISKPGRIPAHKNDDRQPEFALMSKGLGANYLTRQMIAWHKKDLDKRMYVAMEEGKKASMPRYYKEKIYTEIERKKLNMAMKKIHQEKEEQLHKGDIVKHWRDQAEADKAAFKRMHIKSTQSDKL